MPRFLKIIGAQLYKSAVIILALTVETSLGSNCSSSPCMYGICVDDSSSSYRCYCIDGYTGNNCEINWDDCWSDPCLNGGTCSDAVASYNCTCVEGYVGTSCEKKYSECMSYPCQNNGTCLDYNGFTCQCLEGFSGIYCEVDASVCNNTICKNFGECVEGPGLRFACHCQNGWAGTHCEEDINECDLLPCQNGGLCINAPGSYTCACLFGFTGKNCNKTTTPCEVNPCQNNAVCLIEDVQPVCYCVPDYHGTFCESRYDDCESKSIQCQNGGTCIDGINNFTCACPSQYTGDMCALMVETTSIDLPTYFTDSFTTEGLTSTEINTISYAFKDDATTTKAEKCLPDSCATTINPDDPELTTVSDSTNSIMDTTQYNFKPVFSTETQTEYDQISSSTSRQSHATLTDENMLPTSVTQNISSQTLYETTWMSYTKSTEKMYPTKTPDNRIPDITAQTPLANESFTRAFTVLEELPTARTTNGNGIDSLFTTGPATTTNLPSTDSWTEASSDITSYSDGPKATSVPAIELTRSQSTTESIVAFSIESTAAKDYNETITSDFPTFSPTEGISPDATTIPVVTMLPSTIIPELTSLVVTQMEKFSEPSITIEPKMIRTTPSNMDFTTVTEFYTSTFGTGFVNNEVTNVATTTESKIIHSCTKDQCADTSLCIHNDTQCDCSHENNCIMPTSIESAAFSGRSYIRQSFPIDDGALSIFVRLKTRAKSGVLIHALFDDERYTLLYMESGQLKFQFSCGLQTMLFGESDSPINNGWSVSIEIKFQYLVEDAKDKCSARLLVNGTLVMSGEQVLQAHEGAPRVARLHLGGIPVAFSEQFPHIVLGFVGCMSLLKVNDLKRDFVRDSAETFQIEECNSFLCLSNPCKNFGTCKEANGMTNCTCFAGFSGDFCEKSICDNNPCHLGATCLISPGVNFICLCPLGTHGFLCDQDTTVVQPSFSVFVPGLSSYMAYGVGGSVKDYVELKMRIVPQTLEQISLIAYMGQSPSKRESSDHFSITFVRGYLMLTWDLGSGVRRIFTSSPLNARANKAHSLQFGRRGRDSWLYVDGVGNVTGRAAGTNTRLDVSPILYIGGHKSKYFEILPHDLPLHTGFSGCIYDIELRTDDNVFPVTMSSPATGRGVGECYRNECSHHMCKNGAVCLNYGPTYSCICMKDWEGPDCSNPVNCTSSNPLCHKNRN